GLAPSTTHSSMSPDVAPPAMLVAKLPGSTYATAATKAGPRNGSRARRPRVSPLSAFSAARSTRSSPGRAATTDSTGGLPGVVRTGGVSARTFGFPLHVDRARKPERDAHPAALDAAFDGRVELARGEDLDSRPRREP